VKARNHPKLPPGVQRMSRRYGEIADLAPRAKKKSAVRVPQLSNVPYKWRIPANSKKVKRRGGTKVTPKNERGKCRFSVPEQRGGKPRGKAQHTRKIYNDPRTARRGSRNHF